jgi:hypothetical protein
LWKGRSFAKTVKQSKIVCPRPASLGLQAACSYRWITCNDPQHAITLKLCFVGFFIFFYFFIVNNNLKGLAP